jgi:hypothetical protein
MRTTILRLAAVIILALFASSALADERSELEALRAATIKLIERLVSQGVLTQEEANALLRQTEAPAASPGAKPPPPVRVPYVPQAERDKIKEELREEVMSQAKAERWADPGRLPLWADRLVIEGDVRLRLQHDNYDPNNVVNAGGAILPSSVVLAAAGQNISNSTEDTTRLRLRARLGVRANVTDGVQLGIRVGTGTVGSTGNPGSLNTTLGGNEFFTRGSAGIDLAYVRWSPPTAEWFSLVGGRFPNPFLGSELLWHPDLNFDGVATVLRFIPRENLRPFLTLGAFPLRYNEPTAANPTLKNKWLYGTQAGVDYGYPEGTLFRFGVGYFDYRNIEGIPNTDPLQPNLYDWTAAPAARQKGNSLVPIDFGGTGSLFGYASKFRILNVTGELGFRVDELRRLIFLVDWARNIGFDSDEILARTGAALEPRDTAVHLRATYGHQLMEHWGDWFVFGGYRRLDADSALDIFNDGDFHLGGTNAKGWFVGGGFGIGRNAWFGVKYSSANEIYGPPLAIDVLQIDLNARF